MLDINTPKGQESLRDELRCIQLIERAYPGWEFAHTPKADEAAVDGFLVHNGVVKAVVEQKSRYDVDHAEFVSRYNNEWLVTFEKIVKARDIAANLCAPLVGVLYLVRDDIVLSQKIWDRDTGWRVSFNVRKTQTQATINGGKALRDNAYIDMTNAKIVRGDAGAP